MKKMILAAGLSLVATAAFAGATLSSKDAADVKSNGSAVGKSSSSYKGNGDVIGGNGTAATADPSADQTTGPHSRPDAVERNFPGSNNAGGNGN